MKPAEQLRDLLSKLPMMTSYDGIAGEEDLRHAYKVGFADAQHAALKAVEAALDALIARWRVIGATERSEWLLCADQLEALLVPRRGDGR